MINQRRSVPEARRERKPGTLWNPRVRGLAPRPDDVYLVLDEEDGRTLVLVATRWPELDGAGRLRFPEAPVEVAVSEEALRRAVRLAAGDEERPLRMGDVFLVRGLDARSPAELRRELRRRRTPSEWGEFVDVTAAAREAAKTALFAAAAPRVSPRRAEALGLTREAGVEKEPRSATTVGPSV